MSVGRGEGRGAVASRPAAGDAALPGPLADLPASPAQRGQAPKPPGSVAALARRAEPPEEHAALARSAEPAEGFAADARPSDRIQRFLLNYVHLTRSEERSVGVECLLVG